MSWRIGAPALLTVFLLALAGCQSNDAAALLDPASAAAGDKPAAGDSAAAPVSPPPTTGAVGSGAVRIAVLLPSDQAAAERARDVRDGVTMAVDDLGKDVVQASFAELTAKPREGTLKAMAGGPVAVIGPFDAGAAEQVATIKGATLPPVFLLADGVPGSTSIYSVPLQSGISAAAGARAAGKDGALKFVLLTQEGSSAAATERAVDLAVADHGGRLATKARFGADQASMMKAVDMVFAVVDQPDAVVIAGGAFDPATIVKAVRAKSAKAKIVGNSSWISSGRIGPELNGVLIADVDQAELEPIAQRFKARFGHDFNSLAAYAYDVVALSSGIGRAMGRDGFVRAIIEDPKGFRGSTGIFRFRSNGSCERLLALYKVDGGRLKRVEAPPDVF
jgi:ABC-type branched-subunit amino acid transport system substrate-binding protein